MAKSQKQSDKLAEVYAMLEARDEEFRPLVEARYSAEDVDLWDLDELARLLGYEAGESLEPAVDRAKITLSKSKIGIRPNIVDGEPLGFPGKVFVTKVAAVLISMNADVDKPEVATAQAYFALLVDGQALEDEKRLRTRFEVNDENRRLQGAAKKAGVRDHAKFNGVGVAALYGGLSVARIKARKGLKKSHNYLDYAGSEELAANLFRISQTRAALERQGVRSERAACDTHRTIGASIRQTILEAGNTPPEDLPSADVSINKLAGSKKRELSE